VLAKKRKITWYKLIVLFFSGPFFSKSIILFSEINLVLLYGKKLIMMVRAYRHGDQQAISFRGLMFLLSGAALVVTMGVLSCLTFFGAHYWHGVHRIIYWVPWCSLLVSGGLLAYACYQARFRRMLRWVRLIMVLLFLGCLVGHAYGFLSRAIILWGMSMLNTGYLIALYYTVDDGLDECVEVESMHEAIVAGLSSF
jgi:hypothetical protein